MEGFTFVVLGAAVAAFLAGVGSAIGCGIAGTAASGVTMEEPGKFARLLPLQALPGTQGFYGFVGLFLILTKAAEVEIADITLSAGLQIFFAALPVGVAGLLSAIWQGKVCASGCNLVAKRPEELGKALVYAVVVETYAVLGLLATIILLGEIELIVNMGCYQ